MAEPPERVDSPSGARARKPVLLFIPGKGVVCQSCPTRITVVSAYDETFFGGRFPFLDTIDGGGPSWAGALRLTNSGAFSRLSSLLAALFTAKTNHQLSRIRQTKVAALAAVRRPPLKIPESENGPRKEEEKQFPLPGPLQNAK